MWILGLELRSSSLAAGTFATKSSSWSSSVFLVSKWDLNLWKDAHEMKWRVNSSLFTAETDLHVCLLLTGYIVFFFFKTECSASLSLLDRQQSKSGFASWATKWILSSELHLNCPSAFCSLSRARYTPTRLRFVQSPLPFTNGNDMCSPSLMGSWLLSRFPFMLPISDHYATLISQLDSRLLENKDCRHQCQDKGSKKDMEPGRRGAPHGPLWPRTL